MVLCHFYSIKYSKSNVKGPVIYNSGFFFFLYSHNNYMDNYNTKSKGAWKYITTLRLTLNIETLNIQK